MYVPGFHTGFLVGGEGGIVVEVNKGVVSRNVSDVHMCTDTEGTKLLLGKCQLCAQLLQ